MVQGFGREIEKPDSTCRDDINDTAGVCGPLVWRDARVGLMPNLLEGVFSGTCSSSSSGQNFVTTESVDSGASCLVPMETPRAMTAAGQI